jgi:hypothetical protein
MAGKAHRRPAKHSAAAARQRSYRSRLRAGQCSVAVLCGPELLHALEARGLLRERELADRSKLAKACASILAQWARNRDA